MNNENEVHSNFLVTGANGFIGRRVVSKLIQNGFKVRALVLPDEILPDEWEGQVEIIRGSITEPEDVINAVRGVGTIIHLAAVVGDWGDEAMFWDVTVNGSRMLFDQAVKIRARLVLVSSVVVYGNRIQTQVCFEDTPYGKTFGPYSRTKQAQEMLAWEYYWVKNMRLSVVRPANVYGPGSGPWLHDVINVLKSRNPGLISGGDMNAGLVYVDNVADVILLAAWEDVALGRVYNACDGLKVTWSRYFSDIADMIKVNKPKSIPRPVAYYAARTCEVVWKGLRIKKRPPITREALNLVGSDNRFPMDRAQNELGYTPAVSYEDGLSMIRQYIENERH